MLKFLKWLACYGVDDSGSAERTPAAVRVEQTYDNRRLVLPRRWMDSVKVTTLRINLPDSKRRGIKVKIQNRRQLQVHAASQFNCYKLQLQLPYGARLLGQPLFSPHNGVLTCRFRGPTPRCIFCGGTFSRHSIGAKDLSKILSDLDLVSTLEIGPLLRSSLELVEPRYWITYDDNMALFEADLEGCKYSSHIKFHVANSRTVLSSYLSRHRRRLLELRLKSSAAEAVWKVDFDQDMQMFTCNIPLLGYYGCGRCMAVRQKEAVPDTETNGRDTEKVVRVDVEKAICVDGEADEYEVRDSSTTMDEEHTRSTNKAVTCGSKASGLDLNLTDVTNKDESFDSPAETPVYLETSI